MTIGVAPDTQTRAPTAAYVATLARGDNSFGILRLFLALLVIVDHAFPLGGFGPDPLWALTRSQASNGVMAVGGFFVISGYLITSSAAANDVMQFLWKRILRIFPGFLVLLVVTAFVVAPLVYFARQHNLSHFWEQSPDPMGYVTNNWTLNVTQYGIGRLLINTPYGLETNASVFNGSIWSLVYEFRCYLAVALLLSVGVLKHARFIVPILATGFAAAIAAVAVDHEAATLVYRVVGDAQMLNMGYLFALGAVLAVYGHRIPLSWWLGVAALVLTVTTLAVGLFWPLGCVGFAYLILWLAAVLPAPLRMVGRKHDTSYGVYLYGFLVQQLLAAVGFFKFGLVPFIGVAMLMACACGALSWHLVERRALSWKSRGPGGGFSAVRHMLTASPRKSDRARSDVIGDAPVGSESLMHASLDERGRKDGEMSCVAVRGSEPTRTSPSERLLSNDGERQGDV